MGLMLLFAGPLILARIALVGISDPSEGRYAETAREMAEGGSWVVPRWQGVPHLEKPPLAYWSAAAGIRLFGRTEFAVRLGAALALLGAALLTAGIARRLAGPKAAWPAGAALLAAPYPLAVGAACLTGPFLLFGTALFFHSIVRRLLDGEKCAMTWAVVGLAIGFLAKGHVIFLFTILPLAAARTGTLKECVSLRRLALFLLITAPWFVAVQVQYPEFLPSQLRKLTGFFKGSSHYHRAPIYIYAVVLAAGMLPFSLHVAGGIRTFRNLPRPGLRLLLWWMGLPLVVLTLSKSRSWTYILPAAPALAILAGCAIARTGMSRRGWRHVALCAIGGVALLVLAGVGTGNSRLERVEGAMTVFGGTLLACAGWIFATRRRPAGLVATGTGILLCAGMVVAGISAETSFKIHRSLALRASELAGSNRDLILAGAKLPSVAFYHPRGAIYVDRDKHLLEEAEQWGQGPGRRFRPDIDPANLLRTDFRNVLVVPEDLRRKTTPARPSRYTEAQFSIVFR